MYQLILASESPRRRQLLQTAGFVFDVHPVKVSEIPDKNLNIDEQILDIAGRKAKAAFAELRSTFQEIPTKAPKDFLILAADTMVVYHTQTLGKPRNKDEAFEFLRLLSGKVHEVKTGLCLVESLGGIWVSHLETSQVIFRNLKDEEIWTYIESGEPMDKAGAYAIQGLGGKFVEQLSGEYDNVVGLPVKAFENLLVKMMWSIERVTK